MTAIVCLPMNDGIIFVSDGIAVNLNNGDVAGFQSKITAKASWGSVIAVSGVTHFSEELMLRLNFRVHDFDGLLEMAPKECAELLPDFRRRHGRTDYEMCICIAGWSERSQEYQAYSMTSYPKATNGEDGREIQHKAWEARRFTGMWMCSEARREDALARGVDLATLNLAEWDALDLGSRLVFAVRDRSGREDSALVPPHEHGSHFGAGGFLEMTVLQRDIVTQQVLHRWSDEIGKPIDLARDGVMPIFSLGGDRPPEETAQCI